MGSSLTKWSFTIYIPHYITANVLNASLNQTFPSLPSLLSSRKTGNDEFTNYTGKCEIITDRLSMIIDQLMVQPQTTSNQTQPIRPPINRIVTFILPLRPIRTHLSLSQGERVPINWPNIYLLLWQLMKPTPPLVYLSSS